MIASQARARGLRLDVRRLDHGDSIPSPDRVDGLIVMGGPMGAYEEEKFPFLSKESALLGELAHRDRPVLGICLGSQLLAKALRADEFPGNGPEIGFGYLELGPAGKLDPLFAPVPGSVAVFHWHGDTFELPDGAVLLASNEKYSHQAFRFGRCAYGLQFHIEPDSGIWSEWQRHLPVESAVESVEKQKIAEQVGR